MSHLPLLFDFPSSFYRPTKKIFMILGKIESNFRSCCRRNYTQLFFLRRDPLKSNYMKYYKKVDKNYTYLKYYIFHPSVTKLHEPQSHYL